MTDEAPGKQEETEACPSLEVLPKPAPHWPQRPMHLASRVASTVQVGKDQQSLETERSGSPMRWVRRQIRASSSACSSGQVVNLHRPSQKPRSLNFHDPIDRGDRRAQKGESLTRGHTSELASKSSQKPHDFQTKLFLGAQRGSVSLGFVLRAPHLLQPNLSPVKERKSRVTATCLLPVHSHPPL